MSNLQVRDIPDDIYHKLASIAKQENRSITQQTVVILREGLGLRKNNQDRRKALLEHFFPVKLIKKNNLSHIDLIREDRDR